MVVIHRTARHSKMMHTLALQGNAQW